MYMIACTIVTIYFILLLLESDPPSPIPCRHRYNFRSTSPSVNSTYWRHPFEDSYSWRKEAMHIIWRNNTCCEDILNVNWELLGQCQIDFVQHLVTHNFWTICSRKMNDTIFHIISLCVQPHQKPSFSIAEWLGRSGWRASVFQLSALLVFLVRV